jgi:hypothetical protein
MVFTPGSKKYYPKPVTVNSVEHKWIAENVIIGARDDPTNTTFTIYAVLVGSSISSRLQQSYSTNTGLMDLSGTEKDQLQVSRSKDLAARKS